MDEQKSFRKMVAANSKKWQVLQSGSKGRGGHVRTPYREVARGVPNSPPTHKPPHTAKVTLRAGPGLPQGRTTGVLQSSDTLGPSPFIVPGQSESPHAGQDPPLFRKL